MSTNFLTSFHTKLLGKTGRNNLKFKYKICPNFQKFANIFANSLPA